MVFCCLHHNSSLFCVGRRVTRVREPGRSDISGLIITKLRENERAIVCFPPKILDFLKNSPNPGNLESSWNTKRWCRHSTQVVAVHSSAKSQHSTSLLALPSSCVCLQTRLAVVVCQAHLRCDYFWSPWWCPSTRQINRDCYKKRWCEL